MKKTFIFFLSVIFILSCESIKDLNAEQELIDNLDGTITDLTNQHTWNKCIQGQTWDPATNTCLGDWAAAPSLFEFQYCDRNDNSCNGNVRGGSLDGGGNSEAYQTCNSLNTMNDNMGLGNRQGWRVPSPGELLKVLPANQEYFHNAPIYDFFWSAKSSDQYSDHAKGLRVEGDSVGLFQKYFRAFVRCITSQ